MIKIVMFLVFGFVQIMVLIFTFVLRYHLRVFALPGDAQARRIAVVFTGGMLILFIVTSLFFVPVLFTDAPRLPSLFNFSR